MDANRLRARALRNDATEAERHLWQFLRRAQLAVARFRRQVPIAGYVADFVCPALKLVVELDGGQRLDRVAHDRRRTLVLGAQGYRVTRYWDDDVLVRTEQVLEDLLRVIDEIRCKRTPPRPSPSAAAKGRGNGNNSNSSDDDEVAR